jgi:hypothetical protein
MFFRMKLSQDSSEANTASESLQLWHEKLDHVNKQTIRELVNENWVEGIKLSNVNDFFCEACQLGKSHSNRTQQ